MALKMPLEERKEKQEAKRSIKTRQPKEKV